MYVYKQNFLRNLTVKYFANWSTFAEVIIKSRVYCFFFDSQCILMMCQSVANTTLILM